MLSRVGLKSDLFLKPRPPHFKDTVQNIWCESGITQFCIDGFHDALHFFARELGRLELDKRPLDISGFHFSKEKRAHLRSI